MSIPTVKVPKFTATLPVSEESFEFRPFLVKEEKILLLANESDNIVSAVTAIGDIVEQCTFGKIKLENYCLADLQYAFLQIRGKSIGEEFSFYRICGECKHKHLTEMHVDDFEVTEKISNNIIILEDGTRIELKYPGLHHYGILFDDDTPGAIFEVVADCILKIYNEEEVFENTSELKKEVLEFIDNLTAKDFEKFEDFFTGMPVLYKSFQFVCEGCGSENKLVVDSVTNFFV